MRNFTLRANSIGSVAPVVETLDVVFNSVVVHQIAETLNGIFVMRILIPLFAVVGPVLCLWLGYLGVVRRRTIARARFESAAGMWVTGPVAVLYGAVYLVVGPVIFVVLVPLAAAMCGLW